MCSVTTVVPGAKCAECEERPRAPKKSLCHRCNGRKRREASKGRTIVCSVCGQVKRYHGGAVCSACKQRRCYRPATPKRESKVKAVVISDEDRTRFVELVLPAVQRHAGWKFRHRHDCEDLVQEAQCVAWGLLLREVRLGRQALGHAPALVVMAARMASSYRRLTGVEPIDDVLSPRSRVGVCEYFHTADDGEVLERYGIANDPTWCVASGMDPKALLDLL
jgi:hypothetical protein